MPPSRDLFSELGLRRVINLSGTETAYGAAPVCQEVLTAVSALAPHWVDMTELQDAAGAAIAAALGAEAGFVAHCTAAGIAVAVAACMTGDDAALIHQLPDTTGMRNRVVLQRGHSIDYGAPLRQAIALTGAVVVEAGSDAYCAADDFTAMLDERTAAVVFVVSHHTAPTGMLSLAEVARLCQARTLPLIVDAAAEPEPRRFLDAGADLVLTSVHKRYAGLTAALVAGNANLVRACRAQDRGIGRPMKAGKEAVVGTIAALERWRQLDSAAQRGALNARLARARVQLKARCGLEARIVTDATSGQFARLHVEIRPEVDGLTAAELAARLRAGSPAIVLRETAEPSELQMDLRLVNDDDVDTAFNRIAEVIKRARAETTN